jgi:hypothetical protein
MKKCIKVPLVRRTLYLRYGTEHPRKGARALLPCSVVAHLLKRSIGSIQHLIRSHFKPPAQRSSSVTPPKYKVRPNKGSRVTPENIMPEEFRWLVDADNLQQMAHLSLEARCLLFHRQFPDRWLSRHRMGFIMRQAGLSKKKIAIRRMPQRKTQRTEEFYRKIIALDAQVKGILQSKGHLVFADEAIFSARGFQMEAWSKPGQNVELEDRTGNQPCQAICAAVCSCHGLLTFTQQDYSIDREAFQDFLKDIRGAVGNEKIYLFLDNCKVHHAKVVTPLWEELDIEPVWNVAYSPQYNAAVERYWALLKASFRPLLLKRMLAFPGPRAKDTPLKDALREAMNVTYQAALLSIPKFVAGGLEELAVDAQEMRLELEENGAE